MKCCSCWPKNSVALQSTSGARSMPGQSWGRWRTSQRWKRRLSEIRSASDSILRSPADSWTLQASESISKISSLLNANSIEQYFMPLLRRLAAGDWFTSRTSACALFAAPYPLASSSAQEEMRRMFGSLSGDDTPMVRRAAAKALGVSQPCENGRTVPADAQADYSASHSQSLLRRCSKRSSSFPNSYPSTESLRQTTKTRSASLLFPTSLRSRKILTPRKSRTTFWTSYDRR